MVVKSLHFTLAVRATSARRVASRRVASRRGARSQSPLLRNHCFFAAAPLKEVVQHVHRVLLFSCVLFVCLFVWLFVCAFGVCTFLLFCVLRCFFICLFVVAFAFLVVRFCASLLYESPRRKPG